MGDSKITLKDRGLVLSDESRVDHIVWSQHLSELHVLQLLPVQIRAFGPLLRSL